jgi:hypothetical protein
VNDYAKLTAHAKTALEREVINALVEHGSQEVAAAALGWKRTRLQSHLRRIQKRAGGAAPEAPVATGRVSVLPPNDPIPVSGHPFIPCARYILTSAQNNTHVHGAFLTNLEAYAKHLGAQLMVSRFSYNKASYGKKSTKAGRAPTAADTQGLWYDPAIEQYVCDDPDRHGSCRWQLAPSCGGDGGLLWCAEMNILPTAVLPLSGLESYAGGASAIFPHAKIALESVPVLGDREPKFLYTTGAVTQRNYIAKKEGLKGEFHHQYGALLVEVDLQTGHWWCRQLNATDDGAFMDLDRRIADGAVTTGHRPLAINWGDVHASEIDPEVRALNWGVPGCVLDTLRPERQFMHDLFSMRSRSHHEAKSLAKRYEKWAGAAVEGAFESVESEVNVTANLLELAARDWCDTIVVSSNHDRHLDRWLDEADYKQDLPNAEYFLLMQRARLQQLRRNPEGWDALAWAIDEVTDVDALGVTFLPRDATYLIGPPGHEISCGGHGDEGPNGARGGVASLAKMAVRANYGHIHSACIRHGGMWAGVCARRLSYAHGPSSWSISHIVTLANAKRQIISLRGGKYGL